MFEIEAAGQTHPGKVRELNEDSFAVLEPLHLYVVADGMGGHLAGEVASALAIEAMEEVMGQILHSTTPPQDFTLDDTLSLQANFLLYSLEKANNRIFAKSKESDHYHGMASTTSAVLINDDLIIAANVGDSPIYLVRHGAIDLLSTAHTVEAEQAAIDPGRLATIERKYLHMLTRGMGVGPVVMPSACELALADQDVVILCSDGLSNKVTPREILTSVTSTPPKKACEDLITKANDRGGEDNITVVVLKISKVHDQTFWWTTWQRLKVFFAGQ